MDTRDLYKLVRTLSEDRDDVINLYDSVDIELSEGFIIETGIIGFMEDGVIVHLDEDAMEFLDFNGILLESEDQDSVVMFKSQVASSDDPFEMIYDAITGKHGEDVRLDIQDMYNDIAVEFRLHPDDDFEPIINKIIDYIDYNSGDASIDDYDLGRVGKPSVTEAEYQGRKVQLNKPMQGDVKKSKVYVKKPNGKVVKVNFGDKSMKIKKSNPGRRKSFRARHNCDNPGPKWKARYWSCRAW